MLASLLAVPVLLLVILAVLVVAVSGSGILSRLLDTRVLVALMVLNVALFGWRVIAILQAHGDRSRFTFRSWPTWVTGLLVLATVAMHALPGYYAVKAIDTLGSVSLEGGGGLLGDRTGTDVEISAPSVQPEVARGERVTILLVGVDFAPGRAHHLTDTMLVATLDPETGEGAMVSIPRDLYGVPLGDGRVYNAKLNSLMATAAADRATYPLGGPATLKAAIGDLLGTRVHYFAAIDIEGLREVIDTLGGVTVNVERTINDPRYPDTVTGQRGLYIEAGLQHLDGRTALGYVRSRMSAGENDFTRAERQQQLLAAIAAQLTAGNLLVTLPGLLDAVKGNVATDIPSGRISALAGEVQNADLGGMERHVLTPDEGYVVVDSDPIAGYILHPNLEAIDDLARDIFAGVVSSPATP
jgi:LCP family protein required for cell wall assembly